jgi:hypothetical protein
MAEPQKVCQRRGLLVLKGMFRRHLCEVSYVLNGEYSDILSDVLLVAESFVMMLCHVSLQVIRVGSLGRNTYYKHNLIDFSRQKHD